MEDDPHMSHAPVAAHAAAPARLGVARYSGRLAAAGVTIAAAVIAGAVMMGRGGTPRLEIASQAQVVALAGTVAPNAAPAIEADAKACKIPMGYVEFWHDPGAPDSVVTIQSGSYVSPAFALTTAHEMIALPFPAAYQVGKGQLIVHGTGTAVNVSLDPVAVDANLAGSETINVVWDTSKPCA